MKKDNLLQILTTLRLFSDITDSENATRTHIHIDDRSPVREENYELSARTELSEHGKKYEHATTMKNYAGVTRTFITLFSTSVPGIKENEKQVMSLATVKKLTIMQLQIPILTSNFPKFTP